MASLHCFATCSMGPPESPLELKLNAIRKAGFDSIELAMPDLVSFAQARAFSRKRSISNGDMSNVTDDSYALADAAQDVRHICDDLGLKVDLLQPFSHFEGWPDGSQERHDAFKRLNGWMDLMKVLGCQTLQVGSTDEETQVISDESKNEYRRVIVRDLQALADQLATKDLRAAYENWCWSTHAPAWSNVWEICQMVDRSNFGLCLDTFQIAGSEWADPTCSDGLEQHPGGKPALDIRLGKSLATLSANLPADKIFLLQISDAWQVRPPIGKHTADEAQISPKAEWSRKYRPRPYDGGYLPVEVVARAVRQTGFSGPFSVETFDEKPDRTVSMEQYAKDCMHSLSELLQRSQEVQ